MQRREYEPARRVHAADCPDAPPGEFISLARAVSEAWPHDRPHRCVDRAYARSNNPVVRELVVYEPHAWIPSTIVPADAVRALCRTCRGTHGEPATRDEQPPDPPSGLIVVRS